MDAFGDDFTTAAAEVDPAAEFLAREQDQLAGLEDDLLAETNGQAVVEPAPTQTDGFMTGAFENQQPPAFAQEDNDQFGADGFGSTLVTDNGFGMTNGGILNNTSTPVPAPRETIPAIPREEPEKILKWREEQKLRLQVKDEEEEKKKTEMKEQAKKELEDWYNQHKESIEKTRAANREASMNAEKDLVSQSVEMEPGQEWERIAKLCDFNPKASRNSKDVSRMRSIILQLKQSPPVRSAVQ